MGKQSAELAVAGELARGDALAFVSVLIAILFSITCVICVAKACATMDLSPPQPPPPPPPPPLARFVNNLAHDWWYRHVCALWEVPCFHE